MPRVKRKVLDRVSLTNGEGRKLLMDPSKDLAVDPENIIREMADQPRQYSFYASQHETAEEAVKQARYERHCAIEDTEAKVRDDYLTGRGGLSVEAIKKKVNGSKSVRQAHRKVMKAEAHAAQLKVLREAFQQRHGMLQSINSTVNRDR